jgi:capsule polysaccharide export protein KpsE/RkpR
MQATAKAAGMLGPAGDGPVEPAIRKIERMVTIRALRGSIIEIQVQDTDSDFAFKLATEYSHALQRRLTQLSLAQTEYKRTVLNNRMRDASERLARAEAAMNAFRTKYQLPVPDVQLGAAVSQLTGLQGELLAKQVELQTALRFSTDQSMQVKSIRSDIATLETQLHQAQMQARIPAGLTATGIADISSQYTDLNRDLHFAQALYESYARYLEGAAIEELTSDFNMQEIQPPFVDPSYHFNLWALGSLLVLVLFAAASELYMARPPLSRRFARQ